jgi:hypothetical protein
MSLVIGDQSATPAAIPGAIPSGARSATHARTRRALIAAAVVLLLLAAGAGALYWWMDRAAGRVPGVAEIDLYPLFVDTTPVSVRFVVGGFTVERRVTADDILHDVLLWQRMRLPDWNAVPEALRRRGLANMLARYRRALTDPTAWDRMSAADWDLIPQPMRTVAYRHMVAYWAGYYDVGGAYGLAPGLVADTLAAIVMTESWFEHRAVLVNHDGSRDLGLGQASDYARTRLRQLHERGEADASFTDDEYVNPWKATRFVALWMSIMLDETDGDFDAAVRAYNRGVARAGDERGAAYLDLVRQRLDRFIRNRDAPPAWTLVWTQARALEREAWPWTARPAGR